MKEVLGRAVDWYVQLNDTSADETLRAQWQAWLAADPRHAEAWARIERLQGQLRIAPAGIGRPMENARANRRTAVKLLAILLGAGTVGWQGYRRSSLSADYATATGQRKQFILADGTRLDLNTNTWVDLHFDATRRLIELRQGEIFVETARDTRPLSVQTRDGNVRALGTRFNVRLEEGVTRVSVLSDAVEARPRLAPEPGIRLEAGQSLAFSSEQVSGPRPSSPDDASWRQGMLIVVNWRLDAFLAEIARYRPGYLGCTDEVAGLRLSGAYNLDDTDAVLSNLTISLPLKVRTLSRYWVRLEPATA